MFRNHNGCRSEVLNALMSENLIKTGRYIADADGKELEFSIMYNPKKDEEINPTEFLNVVRKDIIKALADDKGFTFPLGWKFEIIGSSSIDFLSCATSYVYQVKLLNSKYLPEYIRQQVKADLIEYLDKLSIDILEGNAMIVPQMENAIISGQQVGYEQVINLVGEDNETEIADSIENILHGIVQHWLQTSCLDKSFPDHTFDYSVICGIKGNGSYGIFVVLKY